MKNFLGENCEWLWTMKKICPPLGMSAFPLGTKMSAKRWRNPAILQSHWYYYEGSYADKHEIEAIAYIIETLIESDPTYLDSVTKEVYTLTDTIVAQEVCVEKGASLEKILAYWKEVSVPFLEIVGMLSYRGPIPIADILHRKVRGIILLALARAGRLHEYRTYSEDILIPAKESIVREEEQFVIKARATKSTRKQETIEQYRKKFEALSFHWFVGKRLTESEMRKRLEDDMVTEGAPHQTVSYDFLTPSEQVLVAQLREWIYLRTFIKDMVNLAAYKLLPVLEAIADAKGTEEQYLPYLTYEEICGIEKLELEEIRQYYEERKNGYSAQTQGDHLVIGNFGEPPQVRTESTELSGNVAFKGKVIGKVKIMHSPQDEFGDAEILVVGMTTPDYLPMMKKAKAFVTDEGGITCHAAIIAREMKKPCIIGTKVATQVLHDGDLVEVDAINGVVRILEKVFEA